MSSFINDSKHFASIKKSIMFLLTKKDKLFQYEVDRIVPEFSTRSGLNMYMVEEKLTEIIDTIIDLQVTCVFLQYKDHYEGTLDQDIRETKQQIKTNLNSGDLLNKPALFKAIQCIFYQTETEFLTDLRPLSQEEKKALNFLKLLEKRLAYAIAEDTDFYQRAPWAIN